MVLICFRMLSNLSNRDEHMAVAVPVNSNIVQSLNESNQPFSSLSGVPPVTLLIPNNLDLDLVLSFTLRSYFYSTITLDERTYDFS